MCDSHPEHSLSVRGAAEFSERIRSIALQRSSGCGVSDTKQPDMPQWRRALMDVGFRRCRGCIMDYSLDPISVTPLVIFHAELVLFTSVSNAPYSVLYVVVNSSKDMRNRAGADRRAGRGRAASERDGARAPPDWCIGALAPPSIGHRRPHVFAELPSDELHSQSFELALRIIGKVYAH
ncbi:hypothetical protein EVAR_43212_1 [Eumeta japonica]|uniref:Uncharacterized protein n=1 Tax=Eumeta variegata TaxID=151549 RepID=A0A4C1WVP5_EUMVA|nr:hypothetical protein EVAR_43212_1 [Eumeta japonica]